MSDAVYVRAPCRLHFGMFSFGHPDQRQFGGVGMMIDPPAVDVEIKPAARFQVHGALADRAQRFAESAAAAWQLPSLPRCQIAVQAPSDHVGLGVGTQLGLAIAAGLRHWLQLTELPIEALAASVGRARRSAVGTYGFQQGGLIIDAGSVGWAPATTAPRQAATQAMVGDAHPTRLRRRLQIPGEWRFVLVRPENQRGLAGAMETDAFVRLPPVPEHVTRELWQITDEEMLPAAQRAECHAFGDAVYRFGRLAGECFAAVQGGPFASAEIDRLVDAIRGRGVPGVGQSSWGPTVFAICCSQVEADALSEWLRELLAPAKHEITISNPNNDGAVIR
jgi:beta-ribofuranosylaminobenzene 5'-phosphate synthase